MRKGFSLVELSIVLVILGLLTGGILAGQSLIRAAELRSISSDFNRYKAALHSFRDKYFFLPGDMPNAVRIWGAQTGTLTDGVNAACQLLDRSAPATGLATCNGDGSGQIGRWNNVTNSVNFEPYRAWQHLANAGLVEGRFAGVTNSTIDDYMSGPGVTVGYNVPASRISQAGYYLIGFGTNPDGAASTLVIPGSYGHVLVFGRSRDSSIIHNMPLGGAIASDEAWNIDQKMDDGQAGTGIIVVQGSSGQTGCASPDTASAQYTLTSTAARCALIFKTGL